MRKRLLSIFISIVMTMSFVGCSSTKSSDVQQEVSTESVVTEVAEESSKEESSEVSIENVRSYWIVQQNFETPSISFEGTLFNDQVVLPLELSEIDAYAAPYSWYPNGSGRIGQASINEILTSDTMLEYSEKASFGNGVTHISPQTSFIEGTGWEKVSQYDEKHCGIGSIYIDNFSENGEELPLSTCYENGWWCLLANENSNHARFLQVEAGTDDKELASNILKKFGTPTYIAHTYNQYSNLDELFSSMMKDGAYYYNLIYEYDDFALDIWIMEVSVGNSYKFEICSTAYFPATYWKVKKDSYTTMIPIE